MMPNNPEPVQVPESVAGTHWPCFALDGSTEQPLPKQRTDTERLDWLEREHARLDPVMRLVVKRDHDRDGSKWVDTLHARAAIDAAMDAAR
jgi:hypothetical protein